MVRIWLNHWFSTAYHIIKLIREYHPDAVILGSNENEHSVLEDVCDEWYREPPYSEFCYADYCLEFCREHQVDYFLPRRGMLQVSKRKEEFAALGVSVMVDDYPAVDLLNHKDAAYARMAEAGLSTLPEYRIVTTKADFEAAYHELQSRYSYVCFKFVHDEGGKSYRLIDNNRKGYASLFKKQNTRMTLDAVLECLSERDVFSPIMMMPFLSGVEVSVDCLKTEQGLIMLPRIKDSTRFEKLTYDPDLLEKTREVFDIVPLEWPCNIQFKYLDGKPYFLEVNTRMSGGTAMGCIGAKVNLPGLAVCKLRGEERPWTLIPEEHYVTNVETPMVL